MSCRRERLGAIGAEGTNGGHAVDGRSRLYDVRGDRLSGIIIERSLTARNSVERLAASARNPVFWTSSAYPSSSTTVLYTDFPCTSVMYQAVK